MRTLVHAVRSLRREPALVAAVVVTFALAIGANAAMFGLVSRLMLGAPPGLASPDGLARFRLTTSYPRYQEVSALTAAFTAVAATHAKKVILGAAAGATEISAIAATGTYFQTLGARPALGRFFGRDEDQLPTGTPVVVLSHSFYRSRFGGNPDVLGSNIVIDGTQFTVIGVAKPGFSGDDIAAVDVFIPLSAALRGSAPEWWADERINLVSVVVRLRDGITPAAASALARVEPIDLEPLLSASDRSSPQARIAKWLLGVALVVLIIATANVGTLLLLRALRARREVAVRLALGATRARLAADLAVRSVLLALAGAAAGLLVSAWLSQLVRATLLPNLAPDDRVADPRVLVVTLALALIAGLAAGLTPIALVSHKGIAADLVGSGTLGSLSRSRAQRALVGVQVALCTLLLVGAGLFVRSLARVKGQELGFSTAHLLLVRLDFREQLGGAREDEVHRDLAERLRGMQGVSGATVVQATPFGNHTTPPVSVPGREEPPSAGQQIATMYAATPEYLRLMDVRLRQGRLFDAGDRAGSSLVVLVNETFAREAWPNESALGKCVRAGHAPNEEPQGGMASATLPCRIVVGVVRDSRVRSLRPVNREGNLLQYYVPFGQQPPPPSFVQDFTNVSGIIVAVAGDPARMTQTVQRFIQTNSATPVYARVHPYQDLLDPQLRPWRLGATLFVAFGALALAIAAVGLFGVISYIVSQRTREIGLRLALGGTGRTVGGWVVVGAVRMVAIGAAVGLVGALAAGSRAQELLFETAPYDPGVLLTALGTLVLVSLAAAAVPAYRAAKVSPMVALRID
jgi:putative ABC transport system permease protein